MAMGEGKVFIGDARDMSVLEDVSVDLIVTSPPYWHIKDYGSRGQIGHGQSLHGYLKDLYTVFRECSRVLREGRRACVNIGDQFARASEYGRYRIIPLHAEVISQMEHLGMDFMGSIIWEKRTTMRTSGGANIMGSYPYPPNGMVEIDYEHILIFKKPGKAQKLDRNVKERSKLSKEEWKELFRSHWNFRGEKQVGHEAMFPPELPRRLIRMFSLKGELVLDPFLGSGTTLTVALAEGRRCVGYEINPGFAPLIRSRIPMDLIDRVDFAELPAMAGPSPQVDYRPSIEDSSARYVKRTPEAELFKVKQVLEDGSIELSDGRTVMFHGIGIIDLEGAFGYLGKYVKGKSVQLEGPLEDGGYKVRLKNRIHINKELVRRGLAKKV